MFDSIKANKDRFVTGIILLLVIGVVAVFHTPFLIWGFFGIVTFTGIYEAQKLFGIEDIRIYTYSAIIWILALFMPTVANYLPFLVGIIFASILAYKKDFDIKQFLPLIYPLTPMLFVLSLYNTNGISSLIWIVAIVASCDIGAYFVGKSIGKRPFSPSSPNKTMEGVIGGVVSATIIGGTVGLMVTEFNLMALVVTFFVAVASIFGDLFESYLKREAGVKDSGDLLPGHGGILDRVDGYLFGGVVMYILVEGLV
jgi:phosphatidate cytidylyltransferase